MFKINKNIFEGRSNEEVKPSLPKEIPSPGVIPEKPILLTPSPEHIPQENPVIPKQLFCDKYNF